MTALKHMIFLIIVATFIICCEKNDQTKGNDKLPMKEFDSQYFKALINGDSISIIDSLSQLTKSKIYTQIGFESDGDSIVLNFGFTVKDEINNSFTLTIWFVVKELVANLDTVDLISWSFKIPASACCQPLGA